MPHIPSHASKTLVLIGAALCTEILSDLAQFPSKYQLIIRIACGTTLGVLGFRNLTVNPDGTPASEPYQPNQ